MQSEVEMSYPNSQTELAEVFRSLGASDPDQWAYSEVHEGIPQLHRYLFLRQAWKQVVPDDDTD
jgi:hypothetical protein